jgi:hypothetical protein
MAAIATIPELYTPLLGKKIYIITLLGCRLLPDDHGAPHGQTKANFRCWRSTEGSADSGGAHDEGRRAPK